MAANTLTPTQLQQVAAYWSQNNFVAGNATANYGADDLQAAASAFDQAFNTTLNVAVGAVGGTVTIINAMNQIIPAPFSGATLQQKINMCCNVLMKRAGII